MQDLKNVSDLQTFSEFLFGCIIQKLWEIELLFSIIALGTHANARSDVYLICTWGVIIDQICSELIISCSFS